jgi:hypothetical protein
MKAGFLGDVDKVGVERTPGRSWLRLRFYFSGGDSLLTEQLLRRST